MSVITPELIAKLPKWAQQHILALERERLTAIEALNDHLNHETLSPFYTEDMLSTGERGHQCGPSLKRRNFQAHHMVVDFKGVHLEIYLREKEGIQLKYGPPNRGMGDVAMIPESYQSVRLVAQENMRT